MPFVTLITNAFVIVEAKLLSHNRDKGYFYAVSDVKVWLKAL
jgi:hypothetical protein